MKSLQQNIQVSEGASSLLRGRVIGPVASLLAHKFLVVAILFLFIALGLPASWMLGKPQYYTEAVIYVSPRFVRNLETDNELDFQSNSQYREYVQQQVRTVNRYDIVSKSLQTLAQQNILWTKSKESPRQSIERLQRSLRIQPVLDTYQITVGLEGDSPKGLSEIVNTVVENYLETVKQESFYGKDQRLEYLKQEQDGLAKEIEQKLQRRTEIALEIGVTTFNDSMPNPYDQLLVNSKRALDEARRVKIEKESHLSAFQGEAGKAALQADVQELVAKDSGLHSLKANLYVRRSELLTKISGLTSKHPGRQAAERELAEIEVEIERASSVLANSYSEMLLKQRKTSAEEARRVEQQLTKEVEKRASEAKWFTERYQEALQLGSQVEQLRRRLSLVQDRINFLNLEANAPGFERFFSKAMTPENPFKGGKKKIFLLFFIAGCFLAAVAPIAIDLIDPRLHTTAEVEASTGFPAIGSIVNRTDSATEAIASDQMLRIAGSILRECRTHNTRTIALTGVKAGAGTTSFSFELAEIVQSLGTSVLVVDANSLNPDTRYLRPVRNARGLVDRISLDEVTAGQELASEKLQSRLQNYFADYNLILLDTAPILASAEAEILVEAADATILIVEAVKVERWQLNSVLKRMEQLGLAAVGVVVNRLKVENLPKSANENLSLAKNLLYRCLWK